MASLKLINKKKSKYSIKEKGKIKYQGEKIFQISQQ